MKKLILLLIITSSLGSLALAQTLNRSYLRENFIKATQSRKSLDSLSMTLEKLGARTAPEECYLGMCQALQISNVSGMWSKLKMLDKSRGHISKAISAAPQDAELRFLRFMLEHNIPSFLGMSGHMQDDLAFVLGHTNFMDDNSDLKKMALEYMLGSKRCNTAQTTQLQQSLAELTKKQYAQR